MSRFLPSFDWESTIFHEFSESGEILRFRRTDEVCHSSVYREVGILPPSFDWDLGLFCSITHSVKDVKRDDFDDLRVF